MVVIEGYSTDAVTGRWAKIVGGGRHQSTRRSLAAVRLADPIRCRTSIEERSMSALRGKGRHVGAMVTVSFAKLWHVLIATHAVASLRLMLCHLRR